MTHFQPSPLLIVVGLSLYFLPSMIAIGQRAPHFATGFVINLLFGWTVIGWMYSLAWAAFSDRAGEAQGDLYLVPVAQRNQQVQRAEHARKFRRAA